jgi:hypothetical protein
VHVRPGRVNPGPGDEPGGWIRARVLAATVPRDASDAVDALASTDGLGAIHSSGWSSGGVFPHSSRKNLGAAVTGLVLLDAPVEDHWGDNSERGMVDGGARAERGGCIRGVRVTVRGAGAVAFFVLHRRRARLRRRGERKGLKQPRLPARADGGRARDAGDGGCAGA